MIQEVTDGDSFRIEAANPYSEDYYETTDVANEEQRTNARPELSAHVENMDAYDVIFLGYPIWWSTMPMPVCTFLEEYNFSGKTIAPFCTHEGGGLERSVGDIKTLWPQATVLEGLAIRGGSAKNAQNDVSEWLQKLETA